MSIEEVAMKLMNNDKSPAVSQGYLVLFVFIIVYIFVLLSYGSKSVLM